MDVVVENLTKSFGYQKAVDSVSFEVKKGEILGFLGPNGAGKTTTLKIMSCFLFPLLFLFLFFTPFFAAVVRRWSA